MPTILFAIALLLFAGVLLWRHWSDWNAKREAELDEAEYNFARRQFRRRMQASGIVAVIAVAIAASGLIADPLVSVFYWCGVLLLLLWVMLLAAVDLASTKFHFAKLRAENRVQQAALEEEVRRIRSRGSNGRGKKEMS